MRGQVNATEYVTSKHDLAEADSREGNRPAKIELTYSTLQAINRARLAFGMPVLRIIQVEVKRRGSIDSIRFRHTALRALFSGRFPAILFSVCNHLGDLLRVGSAKRELRKLLFYPNLYGVPKCFTTLPPSCGKPHVRIAQVAWNGYALPAIPRSLRDV